MGRLSRNLITLIAIAAILGACSSRAPERSVETPTPPGPPALTEPGNVYPPPPPPFSRRPKPVLTKAPGAVIRTEFELSQIGEGQRPGLMLIDVTSRKVEQWTLAEGADDPKTGIANGSYLTSDGRFVLLRTWDQRRFAVERATGETWSWSMQGWREYQIEDDQIIIFPQDTPEERYALRWEEQVLRSDPPVTEPDWIDWSPSGLGIQHGPEEAGLPTLRITDRAGTAQYRIRNTLAPCNPFSAGGSSWTADSSALMVRLAQGDRLLSLSGEILPLPYDVTTYFVPSPTDANLIAGFARTEQQLRFATYQIRTGAELWSATLPWLYTIDRSVPRWSQSGQYLQFGWMYGGGSGIDCGSLLLDLPVKVDKAPFPRIQYLVQGTGDCLHLRKEADRTAESLGCLPDGTLLTPTPSPTDSFITWGPDSERWLHVSAKGMQGWVIGSEGYIGWAP